MNKIRKDKEFSFNTHLISELRVDLYRGDGHPFSIRLLIVGVPTWFLVVKTPPADAGDVRDAGSVPGSGRSPGGGHGNPLQYSRLENPTDRGT